MEHTIDLGYGVIPIYEHGDERVFLLIRHVHGNHWGFPKGHAEPGEAPTVAALRELREETGIEAIELLDLLPVERSYEFDGWAGDRIHKTVYFYLGRVASQAVTLDPSEVIEYRWVPYAQLGEFLTAPHEEFIRRVGERLAA